MNGVAAPADPPGSAPPVPRAHGVQITVLAVSVLFLVAGATAVASGAYIVAADLESPQGEPILWAGVAGLVTGVALALIATLAQR